MQAPTPADNRPPEELLVYLDDAQAAILEHLGEEKAGEVHPVTTQDLAEAIDDAAPDARTPADAAAAQLAQWDLTESRRAPGEDGERITRHLLTDRGKALVLEHGDDLVDAGKPFLEWTREERVNAPFPQEELFHRLFDEVAALRDDLEE